MPQDLTGLILGLAAQATAHLAGEGETAPDLLGARGLITMLEILKDRTRERLTGDEERLLDQVLFELRMAYMAAARGSS